MAKQQDLNAYEDRYRLVFAAGALHWNDPRPNRHLSRLLEQLPEAANCVEFGCGEGYQARFVASRGHTVTGVDLSPTAIAKAISETPSHLQVRFLVGDVTDALSLGLPEASFDLAVDIGCLHMMADDEDRVSYLASVRALLKPEGYFFLQDGLDLDDVSPQSSAEAKELAEAKALQAKPAGHPVPNTIMTSGGVRKLLLPLCPTCRMPTLQGYVQEISDHGFRVVSAEYTAGVNCRYEAVVVALKH